MSFFKVNSDITKYYRSSVGVLMVLAFCEQFLLTAERKIFPVTAHHCRLATQEAFNGIPPFRTASVKPGLSACVDVSRATAVPAAFGTYAMMSRATTNV